MKNQLINSLIDLILENKEMQSIDLINTQRENLIIGKTEDLGNSKYVNLKVNQDMGSVSTIQFSVVSVMFWEYTQNIPIDCILHFKNGYIDSLEVYSCDGRNFENINLANIDIRDRSLGSTISHY